jgi:hypothetical protein
MGATTVRRLVLAAVAGLVSAAGTGTRADVVYSYQTLVEITSPVPVGPDATVGEAFGHLSEGLGNGTIVLEGHNASGLVGPQLIDIADVGLFSTRPPTLPPDTGTFNYLIEVMVSANNQTKTFGVTGTIDVSAANTAVASSTGTFSGVSPVAQTIGGADFQISLTEPGAGYTGPTIGANPLDGHIIVGIIAPAPVAAAVPEPSTLTLAGTVAVPVAVSWWLLRRSAARR